MKDPRVKQLSDLLLDYSVSLKKGDKIYLEWRGASTTEIISELIKGATQRGATPIWFCHDEELLKPLIEHSSAAQIKEYAKFHCDIMDKVDCFIAVNGSDNPFEMKNIPSSKTETFTKEYSTPVHTVRRINNTRWCILRWPSKAFAQMAQQPINDFTEFYFDTCLVDYKKMSKEMDPLLKLMNKTDKIRIVGPDTDLSFSIKGIGAIKCDGRLNIPDGEIFTAPVASSLNGTIKFNAPALYRGMVFENIRMEFRNGVAHKVTCDGDTKALNEILDIDKGARQVGEFAIGVNPKITRPMKDILFDEKIDGSIHLAMGHCYDQTPNGVKSAIHWDLIHIQTKEFGGGELYFDGKLIRKNGKFT